MTTNNRRLMDCLKQIRPIEAEVYAEAEKEAELKNVPLEQLLIEQGVVSDTDMVLATAEYLDIRPISLDTFTPETSLIDLMEKDKWKEIKALPVSKLGSRLSIAMADPFDIISRDTIASSTDMELVHMVALEKEIMETLESISNEPAQALEDILKDMAEEGEVEVGQETIEDANLDDLLENAGEAPVIRIVNSILIEALRKGASDIHIEPMEKTIRLRNRVDKFQKSVG